MGAARQNCYFFVDEALPLEEQVMNCMCEACHEKQPRGWFWEGSRHGYGAYDLNCDLCGASIHKHEPKASS